MGQVRHASATTAFRLGTARRRSHASLARPSRGTSRTTGAAGRRRATAEDLKAALGTPRSAGPTESEATTVAFGRDALRPLEGGLCALQPSIPHLTRSAPHRHDLLRLSDAKDDTPNRQRLKHSPIGIVHIDIAGVQTAPGKPCLLGRTAGFAVARRLKTAGRRRARRVLRHRREAVPCRVHAIPTAPPARRHPSQPDGGGLSFAAPPWNRTTACPRPVRPDMICKASGIGHRLTRPDHPQSAQDRTAVQRTGVLTDGQVERMSCAIKDAAVRRVRCDSRGPLCTCIMGVPAACTVARRLRRLGGPRPCDGIRAIRTSEPGRLVLDPMHRIPRLNTVHASGAG